ncbi:hypothetical protein FisN_25Hh109 [Fistulifera solaris]|uniref:Uncharacterized protein n=1 Tax=Fistulifera solaris TaxID=1519565 RepID=A0A1Z5JVR6_FISSO|nr:hypothetical protein FisN_25Hh109 [Fistulifera solaris]|eukprot:GAX18127.1 hypothetical protein FisN_25Hh109 [Fistulifera solaris]
MPASAGRVRMPHNNRVSVSASLKSSNIWQKTIGHDPYASQADSQEEKAPDHEKAKQVLAVARQQNLTDGANRDDFAKKLYLGLKGGKKRRADEIVGGPPQQYDPKLLEEGFSSSEDEFVEVKDKASRKSRKKSKKSKKSRRRKDDDSSSSDSESLSTDEERRRKRKKRRKKDKKTKRRHSRRHSSSSSSDDSDTSDDSSHSRNRHSKKRHSERRESTKKDTADSSMETLFHPAEQFCGSRKGYVFQQGEQGLGYYMDKQPKVDSTFLEKMSKWAD